jgi:autotransporter-associated beta strand protein
MSTANSLSLRRLMKAISNLRGHRAVEPRDRSSLAIELLEDRVTPAAFHWIGSAALNGNLWSVPSNWLENAVPVSGSAVLFDTSSAGFSATANGFAPVNDLFGLSDLTLALNDGSAAGDFNLTGNAISLRTTTGIAIDSTVSTGTGATIANGLHLAADVSFKANLGTLSVNGVVADGPNTHSLTLINTATTAINLGGDNSYDGGTSVNAGTLGVAVANSLGTGTLTMTGGTLVNLNGFLNIANQFVINGPASIGGGGFFHVDGNGVLNADLTLINHGFFEMNGALSGPAGIISNTFPGNLYLGGTQANSFAGASSVLSGSLVLRKPAGVTTLAAPITVTGGFSALSTDFDNLVADNVAITLENGGHFGIVGHSESIFALKSTTGGSVNTGNGLVILGGGNQSFAGSVQGTGSLVYTGGGTLTLAGASPSFTGMLAVSNGILAVSADFSSASVSLPGGTLGGTGIVKSIVPSLLTVVGYIEPGGPGNIGVLTTAPSGSSSLAGLSYRVDLNASGNNDRLVVGTGASINLDGSHLDFDAANSVPGNIYTVVSSPSGGINGTFSGMPKGSFIVKSGQTFQIDYTPTAVTLSHRAYGIYPVSPLSGVVGVPYSQTLTVAAGVSPYANLNVSAFNGGGTGLTAANVTVDPVASTVTINGTATAAGAVTFTISVTDNAGNPLTRNYVVNFNAPPGFSPATLPDASFGVTYTQAVTATGGAPPFTSLTVSNFNAADTGLAAPTVNLGAGTVTFNSKPTAVGAVSFTVNAVDSAGGTATKNYSFNVVQSSSRVILTSSASGGALTGQNVTFTASVSPTPPATGTASGSVNFFDGATQIGTATLNASGVGTMQINSLSVGSHAITAEYSGNANLAAGTSAALTQVIDKANTTTTLSGIAPIVFRQTAFINATVSAVAPGAGIPVGSVTLFDGGTPIATNPLNAQGVASFTIENLSVGSHPIVAVFVGNGSFNGSVSTVAEQVVNKSPTATALFVAPNATTGGTLVTFTAVVEAPPGFGTPSGSVSFTDGAATLGSAPLNSAGVAVFTTSTLTVGNHSIVANYGGSANFLASASSARNLEIVDAISVQSATLNGNIPALAGPQHSRIASIVVTFNRPVVLDAGAVTLALHTKAVYVNGALQPAGIGALPTTLSVSTTNNIAWLVTFSGNMDLGDDGIASLKDGVYDLKVDAAKVHPVGSPNVNMFANSTTTFHRLFGDVDNAATPDRGAPGVDFAATVNTGDNLVFRGAFNNSTNYKPYLDFNGDGAITSGDNLQFRGRFNKSLIWSV